MGLTREELLAMLDLDGDDNELDIREHKPGEVVPVETPRIDASDTAIICDSWDRARGRDALTKALEAQGVDETAMTDFFAAAFNNKPRLVELCIDQRRFEFVQNLLSSPEWRALHKSTRNDLAASELAAQQFAEGWAKLTSQDRQREATCKAGRDQKSPDKQKSEDGLAAMAAAQDAAEQAEEKVEEFSQACKSFGIGGNKPRNKLDVAKVLTQYRRVKNSSRLRRICEIAGRWWNSAKAAQRQKTVHGQDDVVGIEPSGDVSRILPQELAMLADEDTEDDAIRRIVDNQALSKKYKGVEKKAKGPIVVCVDESGSMDGEPICQAKAFCLTMARLAKAQKRWCYLAGFSGDKSGNYLLLKPGQWDEVELMDWLEHFYCGGTVLDVPVDVIPANWDKIKAPKGKTDIIIITDGEAYLKDEQKTRFLEWKKRESVRCISLIIGGSMGVLSQISDQMFEVAAIDTSDKGIQSCLSL